MLIKSLSLKEFKCFEQVDINFGKITLLTGANSSGKSSLINALLGIMQSKYFPQYFALNGELVNMGGFDDVLRKKAKGKEFEIYVDLQHSDYFAKWAKDSQTEQPFLVEVKSKSKQYSKHILRESDGKNAKVEFSLEKNVLKNLTKDYHDKANSEEYLIQQKQYKIKEEDLESITITYICPFEKVVIEYYDNYDYFVPKYYGITMLFSYLGSFRLPPERTYYRKPNASKVGVNGEGYIDQIIEWEESDSERFQKLLEAVSDLGLFHSIESNKMKGGRFELNVKVNENSTLASLTDVGFGISQFLPIIVADLQLNSQSCLAVSQPEIHLHPKIQATLGDYFAKQVKKTEKQYIVETHSEYLINRLRLLIVKGELQPEDVKLYYMENDGDKTTTYPIELTTDGQIKNAPQGFFDTYEMDVMDIALFASAQ